MTDGMEAPVPPSGTGCVECDASDGWWFHLRRCVECGHVGCCDSSPMQHATRHFRDSGHRVMTSFEPGEDWFFDFETGEMADPVRLAPPLEHPLDQPTPGPAGRVPTDWMQHVN